MVELTSFCEAAVMIALWELEEFDGESVRAMTPLVKNIIEHPPADGVVFGLRGWWMDQREDVGMTFGEAHDLAVFIADRTLSLRRSFAALALKRPDDRLLSELWPTRNVESMKRTTTKPEIYETP